MLEIKNWARWRCQTRRP